MLSANTPWMPTVARITPPIVGPIMRLALLVPMSIDMARPTCSGRTTSPIRMRRTGLSLDQVTPFKQRRRRQVPDFELAERGQDRERGRAGKEREHHDKQQVAALEPVGDHAHEGAEERHRQQPQHGDHGDEEGRARPLIDEHAHRQHLEPAHDEEDEAQRPQAHEVARGEDPFAHEGLGRRGATGVALHAGEPLPRAATALFCRKV